MKWIGAILVIVSCSGTGVLLASAYKREERLLRQMLENICWMQCELGCRAADLAELFLGAARRTEGWIGELFDRMATELSSRVAPDAQACMRKAMTLVKLPDKTGMIALQLGRSLGEFRLEEQLQQLKLVQEECSRLLEEHTSNRECRVRSYQTLGLCTGMALAILMI